MISQTQHFDHIFIATDDWDKSFRFYHETLGWNLVTRWGETESRGAILEIPGLRCVLAEEHAAPDSSWTEGKSTRPVFHIRVDDVNLAYSTLSKDSRVVIEPERTHWGVYWFVLEDPQGNQIAFYNDVAEAE